MLVTPLEIHWFTHTSRVWMVLLPLAKVQKGFQKETIWSCTLFAINHWAFKKMPHYSLEGLLLVRHCLADNVRGNYFFHYLYVLLMIYSQSIVLMIPSHFYLLQLLCWIFFFKGHAYINFLLNHDWKKQCHFLFTRLFHLYQLLWDREEILLKSSPIMLHYFITFSTAGCLITCTTEQKYFLSFGKCAAANLVVLACYQEHINHPSKDSYQQQQWKITENELCNK